MRASWVWQMYVVDLPDAVENARFENVLTHKEKAMDCRAVLFVEERDVAVFYGPSPSFGFWQFAGANSARTSSQKPIETAF